MVSPARPRGGRIKGAPLRALLEMTCGGRSSAEIDTCLATLRPVDRDALRLDPRLPGLGVLAASWYPAVACGGLLDAIWSALPVAERAGYEARAAEQS